MYFSADMYLEGLAGESAGRLIPVIFRDGSGQAGRSID
jgi:hypothetical protein